MIEIIMNFQIRDMHVLINLFNKEVQYSMCMYDEQKNLHALFVYVDLNMMIIFVCN